MAAPKCRIDVWQPTILTVATTGATAAAQLPAAWVKCDTVTDVTSEDPPGPNPNLRRANACTSVEIKDEMFTPRVAYISIANRPQNFRAYDDETMETQHQDSDGNEIQVLVDGSLADVKTRIRRNWGPFSYFFKEFQQIRIVDLETHMVLFTGRVYKVSKKHDGQRGATVELVCKDALEELKNISMKTLPKEFHFPVNTYRSTLIQSLLNVGFDYENFIGAAGINKNDTSPTTTPLSSATLIMNSDDANTSTAASPGGDAANSYSRFERSMTNSSQAIKLKTRKSGSKNILSELTRLAILEPHENETAENQFGYDFFVDSNIGSNNLLATTAPPPAMFNYFKRGNRLSAAGSAGQDADTYGLTCILPTVARATHTGLRQENVGTTAASGNATVDYFAIDTGHSIYPGQVIIVGSEQMYVRFVVNAGAEGGDEEVYVIRGWLGSTAAVFSSGVTIKSNRPATAVMQKDTSSFDDVKDELFTDCDLTYETSYITGGGKLGTREKNKKFEIMFVTDITGNFAWSGLDFDDEGKGSDDDDPGLDSAEILTAYRVGDYGAGAGNTVYASNIGRIQYQSAATVSGSTNFAYIMLSDVAGLPATNYGSEDYVILKGPVSTVGDPAVPVSCKLNLEATEVQEGRPSTAFAAGTTRFRRVFTMTKETSDNIDDIRQEIAARLGQSTIPMKRGDFLTSKAPYYWADFKVRSVTADGSTGQILTVKSDNGTAAVPVTNYGFREGMLVHKIDDATGVTELYPLVTGKPLYGYCYSMTADDTFRVNLTESQSFAVDDEIRLFVPIRAGDAMFVDHILANVYGEHLTTAVNFNEMPVPTTSYSTIGENETRMRMRVGAVNRQSIWNTIAVENLEIREREQHTTLPNGTQSWSFSGTWSYPTANRVAWTAGDLRASDGITYQIAASDTSDASTINGVTVGLGSNGMVGAVGVNNYIIYLDPEGENSSTNVYHFYTRISTAYVEDIDNIIVLQASVGEDKASAEVGANADIVDTPKKEAAKTTHLGSTTSALLKFGAQTHTTDLNVRASGWANDLARREVKWHGDDSDGEPVDTEHATIKMGDGTTRTIAYGGDTSDDGSGTYVYHDGTNYDNSPLAAFVDNKSYYGFIDFAEDPTGNMTLRWTNSATIPYGDDRVLLVLIVVPPDNTKGRSPIIIPFGSKSLSINAVAIAANSITADHITAGSIGVETFTAAANNAMTKTFSQDAEPTAQNSDPDPTEGDIWFDTDDDPITINVYENGSWVERNSNAPEGGGSTIFHSATIAGVGTPPAIPTSNAINDIWYVSDTGTSYHAYTHPATGIGTSSGWVREDVVLNINSGTTKIYGGLIETNRIILVDGLVAGGTADDVSVLRGDSNDGPGGGTPVAARIEMTHDGLRGYSSSGTSGNLQFEIKSSNGSGLFGGGAGVLRQEGLYLQGTTDVTNGAPNNEATFLYFRGATVTAGNYAVGGDGNDGRYGFTNYAGTLYIFSSGMGVAARALSPTVNATFRLGGSTFGWEALYLGDIANVGNAPYRLEVDGGVLKFGAQGSEVAVSPVAGTGISVSGTTVSINYGTAHSFTSTISASDTIQSTKNSLSSPGIYSTLSPAQFNKGMWIGDESAPSTPNSTFIRLYSESGVLKYKNSSGNITTLSGGGGGVDDLADGTYSSPTLNFLSNAGSGLSYALSGSYKGVRISGNALTIANFWSDGSTKVVSLYAGLDMNTYNIYDCGSITLTSSSKYIQTTGGYINTSGGNLNLVGGAIDNCAELILGNGAGTTGEINDDGSGIINVLADWNPRFNNSYDMGTGSAQWRNIYCISLTESSDSRIKTNVQDLTNANALAFIDSLQPRSFNRLTDTGETVDETSYGLIAQEVEEALTGLNIDKTKLTLINLPETETIMREIEEGGEEVETPNPRGLSYTQLIAPLIGAIKELKSRIEVLEGD